METELKNNINNFNFTIIKVNDKYNILNVLTNEHLFDIWYDFIGEFRDGFASIYSRYKGWNFIDKHGNFLFKRWYLGLSDFNKKYIPVHIDGKGWNYIDKNEKILFDTWYDFTFDFKNGFAEVIQNGKYNIINENGKIMLKYGYDCTTKITNNYYIVRLNKKYNIINILTNKYISDIWFDDYDDGYGLVYMACNKLFLKINVCGELYKIDMNGNVKHVHDG